jgi:hypothetical protein
VHFQKTLGLLWRFESPYPAFPEAIGLMRVFSPVVQVPTLSVRDSRQYDFFGRSIASKFVGDDHTGWRPVVRNSLRKNQAAANRSRLGRTRL